jgi:hypothetical protein
MPASRACSNALAGHEAAIVTPLAGTTRDVLREQIAIDGMPLHVIDTAGLRGARTRPRPTSSRPRASAGRAPKWARADRDALPDRRPAPTPQARVLPAGTRQPAAAVCR